MDTSDLMLKMDLVGLVIHHPNEQQMSGEDPLSHLPLLQAMMHLQEEEQRLASTRWANVRRWSSLWSSRQRWVEHHIVL
jgi:hypothetical protein